MANLTHGYSFGDTTLRELPVAAASANIKRGDMLSNASGYVQQASAGESIVAFAFEDADSPSSNGGIKVLADVGQTAVYAYPLDTGSLVEGDRFKTADVGGAQSVDITSTSNDDLLLVDVDVDAGIAYVRRVS